MLGGRTNHWGRISLRFGPDGRLYGALDDGGDPEGAVRLSEWHGKILRLNPDGSIPDVARTLGISRGTVYNKLHRYGIDPEAYR